MGVLVRPARGSLRHADGTRRRIGVSQELTGAHAGSRPLPPVAIFGLALVAGCYEPRLRDCTVSCAADSECTGGQVCGDDGFCAAPDIAGRCTTPSEGRPDAPPAPDAAVPLDAPAIDAAAPDASPLIVLRVQVTGRGAVAVDGRGLCTTAAPQRGDCMYDIPRGVPQTLRALAAPDHVFETWTGAVCKGADAICTFTPVAATTVAAKFQRRGDD